MSTKELSTDEPRSQLRNFEVPEAFIEVVAEWSWDVCMERLT